MWSTVKPLSLLSTLFLSGLILVLTSGAFASARAQGIHATYRQLDNGLKVILYPSHTAPIVSCRLFYVTGSVHEAPGHTGIAHMLEHLLFKGTKTVGTSDPARDAVLESKIEGVMDSLEAARGKKDTVTVLRWRARYDSLLAEQRKTLVKYELWDAYSKAGGTGLNAFTSELMTAYFVTLPKNKVELFLWLEADRMHNAVLREFYPEHDVVMEERRMRVEDSPLGRYWESLMGVFYEAHPYRFPTIGYPSDIRYLNEREAMDHYRRYYKPNNAILVLAGDIDTTWALDQIKRYFGPIARGEEFPILTEEPAPAGEKRLTVHRNDAQPRLDILFHTPGFPSEDLYALDVVEGVLSGKSGRLYQKLVKDLKVAVSASAGNDVDRYTSNFQVSVDMDGAAPQVEKSEQAVWDVLNDMAKHPISERELQRARNQVAASSIRSVENLEDLSTELAYWEMRGGWNNINLFPENVQKVTAEQVRQVCAKYFLRDAATVGVVLPDTSAAGAASGPDSSKAGG